jgi:beta-lactamase class A
MESGGKHNKSGRRRLLFLITVIITAVPAIFLLFELGVIRMPGVVIPKSVRSILHYSMPENRTGESEQESDSPGGEALPIIEDEPEYGLAADLNTSGNTGMAESGVEALHGESGVTGQDALNFISFMEEYINGLNGQYGIYYINLIDGLEFGVNESDEFHAASTVKIPLALCISILMEAGIIQPDRELEYTEDDFETGSGKLQFENYGAKYTVQELVGMSIRLSDNVAANMLIRMLGRRNLKTFMRSVGGRVVDDARNVTCPKDMAIYMKKVYEYSQKSEFCKTLIHHLESTVFNDRLPALLPKDIKVAHKIGNWYGSYHDVGIVFTEKPYVISIMSKGVYENDALKNIAGISKMFFDYFS